MTTNARIRRRRAGSAVALCGVLSLLAACGGGSGPSTGQSQSTAAGVEAPLADPRSAPADELAAPAQAVPRYLAVGASVDDYDASHYQLVASTPVVVVADGPLARSAALVLAGDTVKFTTVRDVRAQPAPGVVQGLATAFFVQAGRVLRLDLTQGSSLVAQPVSTLATACAIDAATALDPNGARALLQVELLGADGRCAAGNAEVLLPSDTAADAAPPAPDPTLRLLAPLATSTGVATALLLAEGAGAGSERLAVYDTAMRRVGPVAGTATVPTGASAWLTPLRHTTHAALVRQGASVHRLDWLGTSATLGPSLYGAATEDTAAVADAHAAWLTGSTLLRYDPGRATIAPFGHEGGGSIVQSADDVFVTQTSYTEASNYAIFAVAKADAQAADVLDFATACCSSDTFSEYLQRGDGIVELIPDSAADGWGGYLYVSGGAAWAQRYNAGAVFAAAQTALDTRTLVATLGCGGGDVFDDPVKCVAGDVVQSNADGTSVTLGTLDAHSRLEPPFDLRQGVPTLARADGGIGADIATAGGWRHRTAIAVVVPGVAGSLAYLDWNAP